MIPQPKKIGPTLVTIAVLVFAINNPEKAAALVNKVMYAVTTFAGAVG